MTTSQQLLGALGLVRDTTPRRLAASARRMRKTGERAAATIPAAYVWLGAGLVAAGAAAWLAQNGMSRRGGRRIADVMVRDIFTIDGSATLFDAARMMRDHNVGALPVVENGRLRGVITDRDLVVRAMARNLDAASTPVRHLASEDPTCAHPDWDIERAMSVMAEGQIGRLPVVDDDNRVVGMVTLSSLALRGRDARETLETARTVSERSARAS